jgi:phenylalanyl-tRNA synthetase alpha chain
MKYQNPKIQETYELLNKRLGELADKADILKAIELKALFDELKLLPAGEKAGFGQEANALRNELSSLVAAAQSADTDLSPLDISAPFDINTPANFRPRLFKTEQGSQHPLTKELSIILDIFYRMGFRAIESREIDDDFHMFASLNFPEGHPARDDIDSFTTTQKAKDGKPFIAPAHTSTMQNRILRAMKPDLEAGQPIAAVIPGRVFRNEDLDARHEHTFYQFEGVYVDENVHAGQLIATLKTFLQEYYQKELAVKTQPFYFPFTEPSFEFALSCPFCDGQGCHICSKTGWIELLGCGMIHPNVLRESGIDTSKYAGFAWGVGIERLVMMKYGIEDIRYFESARLDFLRQF